MRKKKGLAASGRIPEPTKGKTGGQGTRGISEFRHDCLSSASVSESCGCCQSVTRTWCLETTDSSLAVGGRLREGISRARGVASSSHLTSRAPALGVPGPCRLVFTWHLRKDRLFLPPVVSFIFTENTSPRHCSHRMSGRFPHRTVLCHTSGVPYTFTQF